MRTNGNATKLPIPGQAGTLTAAEEARWKAFRSSLGERVFGSIAGVEEVWSSDPFDEATIHAEARQAFSDLLEGAADPERASHLGRGRILLLKGDAGSGKTHLMGALRREVERLGAGYFTYAPMTTGTPDLRRYLLRCVVDGLQRSRKPGGPSAWLRLSDALVELPCIPETERESLRTAEDYRAALLDIRARLLEELKTSDRQRTLHGDFLLGLLALQRRDGNATGAAMRYFRGDPLGEEELHWLCAPQGLAGVCDAHQLFDWVVRAVRAFGGEAGSAFVLCIDQIEELFEYAAPQQQRLPEMVATICSLTDHHPGLVVVLACLSDYYAAMRTTLLPPHVDRLELNPAPILLATGRSGEEVLALVRRRLQVLDAEAELPEGAPADDFFPFRREELLRLQGSRPRSILSACHVAWQRSRKTGELPVLRPAGEPLPLPTPGPIQWTERWNDFHTAWQGSMPRQPTEFAAILAWAVNALAEQAQVPARAKASADLVHLDLDARSVLAGICEGAAQGGKLSTQIDSLASTAKQSGRAPIAVRSTPFAKSAKTVVMQRVGELVKAGGGRVIFSEADWRTVQAWRAFEEAHDTAADFVSWRQEQQPLTRVESLRELVRLEEMQEKAAAKEPAVAGEPKGERAEADVTSRAPATLDLSSSQVTLGKRAGLAAGPVEFDLGWTTRHVAVLGGTGSGKTTLAMTLIEGLLLRGVPAILVDRKGDLARYADSAAMAALAGPLGARFREQVEVALFTPGQNDGRPLALSILPTRRPGISSQDLAAQAGDAAAALATMLGYGESRSHTARRAALATAIEVLLELDTVPATLERLLDLMDSQDPALLQALGYIDPKNLAGLVQDLDSFRKLHARLLAAGAEPLAAERLLGLGAHRPASGKTRLSVISTKFLGGDEVVQFWVAQLMMELARFASAHPSRDLQAVVMLDEADVYLPAIGKPASKQPVENALRRFRSGGLSLILATQSPGDFDYRCRENVGTWLVGKVGQARALEKLRPIFGDAGAGHLEQLGQQVTGEFRLVRADALIKFQADRNLLATEQMSDAEILHASRRRA